MGAAEFNLINFTAYFHTFQSIKFRLMALKLKI